MNGHSFRTEHNKQAVQVKSKRIWTRKGWKQVPATPSDQRVWKSVRRRVSESNEIEFNGPLTSIAHTFGQPK